MIPKQIAQEISKELRLNSGEHGSMKEYIIPAGSLHFVGHLRGWKNASLFGTDCAVYMPREP